MSKLRMNQGIGFKFTGYLILFSIILTAITTAIELRLQFTNDVATIGDRLNAVEQSYASGITTAMWYFDDELLKEQLDGILKSEDVVFVEVGNADEATRAGEKPSENLRIIQEYDLNYQVEGEPNVLLGQMMLMASMDDIYGRMWDRADSIILTEGAKVFLLSLFIWLAFRNMVTKHFGTMANYTEELSLEHLDTPLKLDRHWMFGNQNDEFGQVSKAINGMRESLKQELKAKEVVEQEIKQQKDFLDNVLTNIPSSIYWKDTDLKYLGCNLNFAKDAGLSDTDNATGKSDQDLPWSNEEKQLFLDRDKQLLKSEEPKTLEESLHRADASIITILTSIVPLRDKLENLIGLLGVYTDITERKKAEEKILELNKVLEKKVVDRTEALRQSHDELSGALNQLKDAQDQLIESEKMASLGSLVAGVAHEINTPIGISVTAVSHLNESVERLLEKYSMGEMSRKDLGRFLDIADEASEILLKNLKSAETLIKSFEQVAVDQSSDEVIDFNLKQTIDEIMLSLRPRYKKRPITLQVHCADNIQVNSNPGALIQIISNLITNSLIHGYDEDSYGTIKLNAFLQDDEIVMDYSDDGKGISAKHIEKIFDPFFTTKRGSGGSGLGLHILFNKVSQGLKGAVEVESDEGRGTRFHIRFPQHINDKPNDSEDNQTASSS